MVVQKYSTPITPTSLPLKVWALMGCIALGWMIAWMLSFSIAVFLLIAVVAGVICVGSYWLEELRTTAFFASAVAIGLGIGVRFNQMLPPGWLDGTEMLAWMDGSIEEVISINPRTHSFTCITLASVDPKFVAPKSSVRILLSGRVRQAVPRSGDRIVGTVRIRTPRTPWLSGDFSEWQYCAARSIELVARAIGPVALLPPPKQHGLLVVWRDWLSQLTDTLFTRDESAQLAEAMVLGKRDRLGKLTRDAFALSGTAHVLSVSGFHVGIVATIVLLVSAPLGAYRWLRSSIAVGATWLYVLLSGAAPPSIRAGVAFTIATLALALQRWTTAFQILCIAVLAMVVAEPTLVLSPSFQLSVAAMVGITTIGKELSLRSACLPLPWWVGWIIKLAGTTVAAMLLTAPIVALYFEQIPLIGILANIAIVPLATAFIIATIVALCAGAISIPLGTFYASVPELLAHWIDQTLGMFSSIEGATIRSELAAPVAIALIPAAFYLIRSRTLGHFAFRAVVSAMVVGTVPLVADAWKMQTVESTRNAGIAVSIRRLNDTATVIGFQQYHHQPDWDECARAVEQYAVRHPNIHIYLVTPTALEWKQMDLRLRHDHAQHLQLVPHDSSIFAAMF